MRSLTRALAVMLAVLATLAATPTPLPAAQQEASAPPAARAQDLVGTWRLVTIEVEGPAGRSNDPFFGKVESGLLIYDASGWVSVQIVSSARPKVDAPAARQAAAVKPGANRGTDSRLKAQLTDGYYAYFGTWSYDAQAGVVTHVVSSALDPGEEGAHYAQQVRLNGARMIFSREVTSGGGKAIQKKIWERVTASPPPAP